mgnify:CR=1 FL=1
MAQKAIIIGLAVYLGFLLMSLASADTSITVKTLSYHDASIYVLDSDQIYYLLESFHKNTANSGEVKVVTNVTKSKVKIRVLVKKNNAVVLSETFEGQSTGKPLVFEVYPEGYVSPSNKDTLNVSTNISANLSENSTSENSTLLNENITENILNTTTTESENITEGITGRVTEEKDSIFSKSIFIYIVLGIIIAGGIFLIIMRKTIGKTTTFIADSKPKKQEIDTANTLNFLEQKKLEEAERKIREAQAQINALRNKEKITDLERRIAREQDELRRLKQSGS